MSRFRLLAIIFASTAGIVVLLHTLKPTPQRVKPIAPIPLNVNAITVSSQNFQVRLPSQGLIEAKVKSNLSAQVSGTILQRSSSFEQGGRFEKGEILLTLDDRDYSTALTLARANHSKAIAALEEEHARAEQALKDWRRLGREKEPSDLVARRPQVAAVEERSAAAAVDMAKLDLERTRIVVPFDGHVVGQTLAPGNYVTPGLTLGFGILFATLITLILVPCHFLILDNIKVFLNKLR